MSAANMEGNIMALDSRGGKPIPYSSSSCGTWKYKINNENGYIKELVILKDDIPYSTFHAKTENDIVSNIRSVMKFLYDLASCISEELLSDEIASFLFIINNITYDLSKYLNTKH
jgi:hypothetical protein